MYSPFRPKLSRRARYPRAPYRPSRMPNLPIRTPSGTVPGPDYPFNWPEIRRWVLQRDGYQCTNVVQDAYGNWHRCPNTEHLEISHIIAKSTGGQDTVDNLRTLCRRCHALQHPHLWRRYIQDHPEESYGYQPQVYQPQIYPQLHYPSPYQYCYY